jgi:AraC-like DNA-binding protein
LGAEANAELGAMSLADWREQSGRCIVQLDFEPWRDTPFRARLKPVFEHGGFRVARAMTSAGTAIRDHALAKLGAPSYDLLIAQGAGCQIAHGGQDVRLRVGDAVFLQNWEPGRLFGGSGVGYICLVLPAEAVEAACGDPPSAARLLRREDPALALLRGYLRLLETQSATSYPCDLRRGVARHLLDLALAASGAEDEQFAPSRRNARTAMAIAYIERHFAEPDHNSVRAAQALGISQRYLERLLEMSGQSFVRRVTQLRLECAHALLVSPSGPGLRVSDIALQSGFSDVSHFIRCFRARYGVTPGVLRG